MRGSDMRGSTVLSTSIISCGILFSISDSRGNVNSNVNL